MLDHLWQNKLWRNYTMSHYAGVYLSAPSRKPAAIPISLILTAPSLSRFEMKSYTHEVQRALFCRLVSGLRAWTVHL